MDLPKIGKPCGSSVASFGEAYLNYEETFGKRSEGAISYKTYVCSYDFTSKHVLLFKTPRRFSA